jgi:hypothetical protein
MRIQMFDDKHPGKEDSMSRFADHLSQLNYLEARIDQLSDALAEASARLVTFEQRGPLVAPNVGAWEDYTLELEHELKGSLQNLSMLLAAHHLDGTEIPQRKDKRAKWWNTVRGELARETSGTSEFTRYAQAA